MKYIRDQGKVEDAVTGKVLLTRTELHVRQNCLGINAAKRFVRTLPGWDRNNNVVSIRRKAGTK